MNVINILLGIIIFLAIAGCVVLFACMRSSQFSRMQEGKSKQEPPTK